METIVSAEETYGMQHSRASVYLYLYRYIFIIYLLIYNTAFYSERGVLLSNESHVRLILSKPEVKNELQEQSHEFARPQAC